MNAFHFSATSLQDFVDCERRFQLRYVAEIAWPGPESDTPDAHEDHTRLGRDLHRLIHQHLLGISVDALSASVGDQRLEQWWRAYLQSGPCLSCRRVIPEVALSTPLAGHRLSARYDAIALSEAGERPGIMILEWKTYRRHPPRQWLADRLQSWVYPFVLVQAGACLNEGHAVDPDQIEMYYWLAEHPTQPERFAYSVQACDADAVRLERLVAQIARRLDDAVLQGAQDGPWPLTSDMHLCRYCIYRTLCRREVIAGPVQEYLGEGETEEEALPPALEDGSSWGQVQDSLY